MKKMFGIALAAFAMIGTASASDFYVTGNVTDTHVKSEAAFSRNSELGGSAGLGYDINSWLAVEGTYDYVKMYGSRVQSGAIVAVVDPTLITVAGVSLKAVARAGYAYTLVQNDTSDTEPTYGVGLALGITKDMDVIAGYTRRTNVGNEDVNLDTAALGLKYTF